MILRVPDYYETFRCIADRCRDSCCIGWEIDIDEYTYDYYCQVNGKLGERLRREMYDTPEGEHSFRLASRGRCPFLNECNLCDIITELGEEAISEVCTEYPRFSIAYGSVLQKCMSLSCEEAGRLVFTRKTPVEFLEIGSVENDLIQETDPEEAGWYARMEELQKRAIALLQDRRVSVRSRMLSFLNLMTEEEIFVQTAEEPSIQTEEELSVSYGDFRARIAPFLEMETLDGEWRKIKSDFSSVFNEESYPEIMTDYMTSNDYREEDYEQLMVYFTFRYLMNAVYDYDFLSYGKLALVFTLVIRDINALRYFQNGGCFSTADQIDTARIFSKEVEHSQENVDLAREAFLFDDIFKKEALNRQISSFLFERKSIY